MKNVLIGFFVLSSTISFAQKKQNSEEKGIDPSVVGGLNFRLVGPALTSGRIADIAIPVSNPNTWYVAAASGGVWKTTNHGTTFSPIFDSYGSYSIACVEIAPSNENTIWVGTGENNNQRSVAFGDGVYKSMDGGATFTNMGLNNSEHIGNIIIHPSDENTVWVAAYGPVWSNGGERGVYKSTDGGKTWKKTLDISIYTGISEIAIDPFDPNILYAAAHQRQRKEWTYIGGGPESGIYKSTDGGETWKEINTGLPKGEMGRIGIAVSPVNPDYVYAIIEGRGDKGGFFRSTNRGENWTKMSGYATSGNYYQEIICDLTNKDKVFAMDTWLHHTENGGKNFNMTGEDKKHVDNHCIWIDPANSDHWIVGCDGGLYETYNQAKDWRFYDNLPIIQFYKAATDNALPFYNIYGGTQDNNSMGGPSSTISDAGVLNSDWFITNGGDGFESAIDPVNPNIVYAQAQYGWLVRFDKASGEKRPIQPMPSKDESAYRWNWDAPLLISPHDNKTLYFAANKLFKSENRGDDWQTISPDLTQQIDRNKLKVMDQIWSIDAVMKNQSTTIYGNIVALDESIKKKGLLYTGSDDGLIQVSEDGGQNWRKISTFQGVPSNTRVNMICAGVHDENVVFAVFNNHRSGDFKPYLMKSSDKGKTWISISGNLPERGSVYCIRQDHVDPELLFAGTEFGAYFSNNGGKTWTKLSGLPTIAVFDLEIQKRENDLVAATFGRGFYVLDNYSPLRYLSKETLEKEAELFEIKDALLYVPATPFGLRGTGSQGANLWNAENMSFGATFTLYLKDVEKTLKEKRQSADKEAEKKKENLSYPEFDALLAEEQEEKTQLIWIIRNSENQEIRRIISSPKKGTQRVNWDLRKETTSPIRINKPEPGRYSDPDLGYLVTPGKYTVEVVSVKNGVITQLADKKEFNVTGLNNQTLLAQTNMELANFRNEVAEISRSVGGTNKLKQETENKLKLIEFAVKTYPNTDINLLKEIDQLKKQMDECDRMMYGDNIRSKYEFETLPGITGRLGMIENQLFATTTGISETQRENLIQVMEEYTALRLKLDDAIKRLKFIEQKLAENGIPYTQGKDENWKED